MRIDKLLVLKGYFSTRQKAKEAIRRGFVIVNGKIVKKPSLDVNPDAEIVILQEEKPRGYWKLKELDEEWNIIKEDYVVLDLGSSAGGFLLYASEKARKVYGIEYSREFEKELKRIESSRDNVKIFIDDAFKFDLSKLEPLDLILSDLTLEPISALKATLRFIPILKPKGKILFIMKTGLRKEELDFLSLKILKVKDSRDLKERYYLLEKP